MQGFVARAERLRGPLACTLAQLVFKLSTNMSRTKLFLILPVTLALGSASVAIAQTPPSTTAKGAPAAGANSSYC